MSVFDILFELSTQDFFTNAYIWSNQGYAVGNMSFSLAYFAIVFARLLTLPHSSAWKCISDAKNNHTLYQFGIVDIICPADSNSSTVIQFYYNVSKDHGNEVTATLFVADYSRTTLATKRLSNYSFNGTIIVKAGKIPDNLSFKIKNTRGSGNSAIFSCGELFGDCLPQTSSPILDTTVNGLLNATQKSSTPLQQFTFTSSLFSTQSTPLRFQPWYFLFIVPLLLLIIVICFMIIQCKRGVRYFAKFKLGRQKNDSKEQESQNDVVLSTFENTFSQKTQEALQKSKRRVKLFVVFSNDHAKHSQVVVNFVKFLQADLGFEVFCELFQSQEISVDPFNWMERCLKKADKVVVIWSPGSSKQWIEHEAERTVGRNMCTPILKRIRNDLFLDVNIGKYYFGYFGYCQKSCIPEFFLQPRYFHFKLMHDFEELFFRLKGIEMYLPGGVIEEGKVKFSRYADSSLNKYGKLLEKSINEMTSYATEHPAWYEEDPEVSLHPDLSLISNEDLESKIANCHLAIVPPPSFLSEQSKTSTDSTKDENFNVVHESLDISSQEVMPQFLQKKTMEINVINNSDSTNDDNSNTNHANMLNQNGVPKVQLSENYRLYYQIPTINTNENKSMLFANGFSSKPKTKTMPDRDSGCSTIHLESKHMKNSCNTAVIVRPKNEANFREHIPVERNFANDSHQSFNCDKAVSVKENQSYCISNGTASSKVAIKTLSSAANQRPTKAVELAPLDTKSDPMISLMSLNELSTYCV